LGWARVRNGCAKGGRGPHGGCHRHRNRDRSPALSRLLRLRDYLMRSVYFFELALVTYFLAFLVGLKLTLTECLPFASEGSATVTLPLAFATSLAFTEVEPTLTVTVPVSFFRPAALTLTTTFEAKSFAVTLGLPLATFFAADAATPAAYPSRLAVTRTE